MTTGSNNEGNSLLANGTVEVRGQIVAEGVQAIQNIIEVLNLSNGTKSAQCHSNSLTNNGRFSDSGIENTGRSKQLLKSFSTLIYISNFTYIFSKQYDFMVFLKESFKIIADDDTAVHFFYFIGIGRRDRRNIF